jgi:hypothetical protein
MAANRFVTQNAIGLATLKSHQPFHQDYSNFHDEVRKDTNLIALVGWGAWAGAVLGGAAASSIISLL